MNLTIISDLVDHPSEPLYFRHFTMVSKLDFKHDILLECEKQNVDIYYKYLKKRGIYDFVDEIVLPEWKIEGIRVDKELNYPATIKAQYIRYENVEILIKQLKTLTSIF